MISLFVSAFLLGVVFNATPGAVFAETVRRGSSGGYPHALAVQLGSLLGDATWALLGLIGVGLMLRTNWLRFPVGIVGSAYLTWLAWQAWQSSRRRGDDLTPGVTSAAGSPLRSGALISLTNPQNVVYWAAIGGALVSAGVAEPRPADYAIFFTGFMASSVIWCFFFAAVVGRAFNSQARWTHFANELCALAFLLLAALSIYNLVQVPIDR
jgi:chemosensory pili system protein ChpE/L-lysine exporter family protein LysE/ArgO